MLHLFFTVFILGIRLTTSMNEGDECVVRRTNVKGVCTLSSKCQSSTDEYRNSGIQPTFCVHNFDTILVCCSDNRKIFDTAPSGRRLVSNRFAEDETPEPKDKTGEECVVSHTNVRGVCAAATDCQSATNDYRYSGIHPTFCVHNFDTILVCCSDNRKIFDTAPNGRRVMPKIMVDEPRDTTPRADVNRFGYDEDYQRPSERKCAEYSHFVTEVVRFITPVAEPERMNFSVPKCNYEHLELILGGQVANQGEFPHMAAIGWVDVLGNYVFHCGGSLISSRFVLSAGHCIKAVNKQLRDSVPQIVRLGDHNLNPLIDDHASPIDVAIKGIHTHPDYAPPVTYDDIALFELNGDVDFRTDIRPACLWTKPDLADHTKAIATGWGVVDPRRPTGADELRKVSLTLMESDFCNRSLVSFFNRNWWGFSEGQLCAGELTGGKDTCQGDSGAPLQVASRTNKCVFYIVGVTSFGRRCGLADVPAVYTRVSSYLDWIEGIVWPGE